MLEPGPMSGPIRIQPDREAIPDELRERPVWVAWRVETRDGDPTKVPVNPATGRRASGTDPADWGDFGAAWDRYKTDDLAGIGYVFTSGGPFVGVDLDDCRDPETGELDPWAETIVDELDTYAEVSPSGTGVHCYVKGELPSGGNRRGDVEMYEDARYFTVTGEHIDRAPFAALPHQDALESVHAEHVKSEGPDVAPADVKPAEPVDLDNRELIEKAKNADDGGKFARLWDGETSGYPSHSEARMALLNKLAFWTGGDPTRMDRLFRDSGLYPHPSKPGKWDRIGGEEVEKAIRQQADFYEPGVSTPGAEADGGAVAVGGTPSQPGIDLELSKEAIRARVGAGDDENLRTDQIAFAASEIIGELENEHFRWITDNSELWVYDGGVWKNNPEIRLRPLLRDTLGSRFSQRVYSETELHLKSHSGLMLDRDDLGAPDGTIAVENGLLDLLGREVRALEPEDYATVRLPTHFDESAGYSETEWVGFLEDSVASEDQEKLQEYAGYLLWHHSQPFGKAMFLVGPTDSGKGTFIDVLVAVLGRENLSSQSMYELMQSRFGTAELHGKMANVRNEVTGGGLKNPQKFKELTGGGDMVSAERKNQDPFQFEVTQKFLFATNDFPSIQNAGEPFFNRVLFARFPDTVPTDDQDEELADRLAEQEASAILNWMLDGLERLMEQRRFTGERSIDEKREIANAFGNAVDRFRHNVLEITGHPDDLVHKGDLYDTFVEFADSINEGDIPKQGPFTRELKQTPEIGDGKTVRIEDPDTSEPMVYNGVQVREAALDEFDLSEPRQAPSTSRGDRGGGAGRQTGLDNTKDN